MWLGQLFRELKDLACFLFFPNAREDLCAGLRAIGVDAQIAGRGRPEEKTNGHYSEGVIDVSEGPIRWVNVVSWGGGERDYYQTDYGVPDPRWLPRLNIRSIRMRSFPIFGRGINVRWKGDRPRTRAPPQQ